MRAKLSFDLDGRKGDVPLPSIYTIGRSPTCDLVLDHMFVSNVHCTFMLEPHGVALFDHESSNGTLLNGVRVRGKALLREGDVIEVGPHAFTLLLAPDQMLSGAATAQRPAMMMNLGVQRSTFTDQAAVTVRPTIEVVDTPRRSRCFRDVVKAKDASIVAIVGDFAVDAPGEIFANLRKIVRSPLNGSLRAMELGLQGGLERVGLAASLLVVRVEPSTGAVTWSDAQSRSPSIVRKGRAHQLEGHEATMMIGDVLVIPSAAVAGVLAAAPEGESALGVKEARSQIVSIWIASQLEKTRQDGCAVCIEILGA